MPHNERASAEESLNDLGHVASGVGHHVINAFSAVVSNAEILRLKATKSPVDPVAIADVIINTALEASTVARRLIDYTRPMTQIGEDQVDLGKLVSSYIERKQAVGRSSVEWSSSLAPVPPIRGNAGHLHSMLDLLEANSVEAMDGDSVRIHLATSVDSRGWVVLEFRDDGRGMEPDVLERAVEPFFTTKPGRLGVGLTIANGIWRRHKGTLSLRGAPGEGTTLRLCVDPILT